MARKSSAETDGPGKIMKPGCRNCKYKCETNVGKDKRVLIFYEYYSLTKEAKTRYIMSNTDMAPTKRHQKSKIRKHFSFSYYFPVDDKRVRVCQTTFLNTLCISSKKVYYTRKNSSLSQNF